MSNVTRRASAMLGKKRLSPIFEDIFSAGSLAERAGGFWDITIKDGALDQAGNEAINNGDQIHRLVQLVPSALGSDITIVDVDNELPAALTYRTDVQYATGNNDPKVPLMWYPAGFWDGVFDETGNVQGEPSLFVGTGNAGLDQIPDEEIVAVRSYTLGIAGVKTLHLLDLGQEPRDSLDTQGYFGLGVPEEPGTLIITYTFNDQGGMQTRAWSNGVELDITNQQPEQPPEPVDLNNIPASEFRTALQGILSEAFLFATMPCWATQKFLLILRAVNDDEVIQLTNRMNKTLWVK